MRNRFLLLALICALLLSATSLAALAEEAAPADAAEQGAAPQASTAAVDNIVTTRHTATIQGRELAYTADTGTMVLESGGETCEIFFTAYTLDGVDDPADRPVTFAFNGGPG